MDESNSEPPRCPCGFYGSPQTLGLCSKCYRENEHNRDQLSAAMRPPSDVSVGNGITQSGSSTTTSTQTDGATRTGPTSAASSQTDDADVSSNSADFHPTDTTPADSEQQRGQKRKEIDDEPDRPAQKDKKRCFVCNCRLELAVREIGKCSCDYVFCSLHRLPEQHSCTYDYKERGREDARAKMVTFKKHVGTSLKRLDSDL